MDTAFTHLLAMLGGIADPRRAEGKLYGLPHVFLFSILAVMAGANSYRAIHSFIDVHLHRLKETFELNWRRAPAYTTVRGILQGLAAADVEKVFRLHAQILNESAACRRAGVETVSAAVSSLWSLGCRDQAGAPAKGRTKTAGGGDTSTGRCDGIRNA